MQKFKKMSFEKLLKFFDTRSSPVPVLCLSDARTKRENKRKAKVSISGWFHPCCTNYEYTLISLRI